MRPGPASRAHDHLRAGVPDHRPVARESPQEDSAQRPISQWTGREIIAEEIERRGICKTISARHAGRLLKKGDLEPHLVRYRLTPPDESDDRFDAEVADIREVYREAPVALAARGERVVSTDEMTGVQAPEREQPNPPLAPGKVQRRELEYIPATGQPRSSSVGTW
jgi:hypothetical protein